MDYIGLGILIARLLLCGFLAYRSLSARCRWVQFVGGILAPVNAIAFSPDGTRLLASGYSDGIAWLWDTKTGKLLRQFTGHTAGNTTVAFSPDGKYVLTGSEDKTVKLWAVE